MHAIGVLPVLLVLLPTCFGQPDDILLFDCRRSDATDICGVEYPAGSGEVTGQCLAGGTGECTCDLTGALAAGTPSKLMAGTQCGYDSAVTTCSITDCGSGVCGTDADGTEKCFCDDGYTGAACDVLRVRTTCGTTSLNGFFDPYGGAAGFGGKIFIQPAATGSAPCDVKAEVLSAGGKEFKYDGTTCNGLVDQTAASTKSFKVYVQYHPTVKSNLDQIVEFQCFASSDGEEVDFAAKIYKVNDVVDNDLVNKLALGNGAVDLTAELLSSGVPVDPTVAINVGTALQLKLTLAKDSYNTFQLTTLTAAKDDVDTGLINLIGTGCPSPGAGLVLRDINRNDAGTDQIITLDFVAFKFDGVVDVHLKGKVKLCLTANDANCLTVSCTIGGLSGFGKRRRRDVADDAQNIPLNVTLMVVDPAEVKDMLRGKHIVLPPGSSEVDSCLQNIVFLVPLAILAVLLLLAMFLAVFFCLKLNHTRKMLDEGTSNMAYKS